MAEVRAPRDLTMREKTTRPVYRPPSSLPDPTPEPGWEYRWVATHVLSQPDASNVSRKMREGWEPVKAADHPELLLFGNEKTGNVEIGGLMLCKMPTEQLRARTEYYDTQAQSQMSSVDNSFMRQNDPRMPLFNERRSEVKFGRGSSR